MANLIDSLKVMSEVDQQYSLSETLYEMNRQAFYVFDTFKFENINYLKEV